MAMRRERQVPAGMRSHRIMLQRLTVSRDGYGGQTETWTTFAERWAAAKPLSGNELPDGERLRGKQMIEFTYPYEPSLRPQDRIWQDDKVYNPREIRDVGMAGVTTQVVAEHIP